MSKDLEHIDQLFSDHLSGDTITPPAEVWAGVQSAMAAKTTAAVAGKSLLIKWMAGIAIAAGGVATTMYLTKDNQLQSAKIENTTTVISAGDKKNNKPVESQAIQYPQENANTAATSTNNNARVLLNSAAEHSSNNPNTGAVSENTLFPSSADKNRTATAFSQTHKSGNVKENFDWFTEGPKEFIKNNNEPIKPESNNSNLYKSCRNLAAISAKKIDNHTYTFTAGKLKSVTYWLMSGYRLEGTGAVQSYSFPDELSGNVWVKVFGTNTEGCFDSSLIEVLIQERCPSEEEIFERGINVFTPNNDNINDVYYIQNTTLKEFEMSIINLKKGTEVYKTNQVGKENGWNGTYAGRNAEEGWYRVVVKCYCNGSLKTFKREIKLIR